MLLLGVLVALFDLSFLKEDTADHGIFVEKRLDFLGFDGEHSLQQRREDTALLPNQPCLEGIEGFHDGEGVQLLL